MEILSRVHERNLVAWAKDKPRVVVLSADLTGSTEIAEFKRIYPDRFFSMGVAEQNMVSFAAGLARGGYIPLIHTFSVFIYRQALNQIVSSVAYPNLPVKFFGFLPGITTPGGATHQAIEDVAVMRAVPNMTVFEPGDATEVETILDSVMAAPGPVYVRMPRGEIPRLFPADEGFAAGRVRVLSEGGDITLVTSGICTEEAMRAAAALSAAGLSLCHLHVSTHKPIGGRLLLDALAAPPPWRDHDGEPHGDRRARIRDRRADGGAWNTGAPAPPGHRRHLRPRRFPGVSHARVRARRPRPHRGGRSPCRKEARE